MDVILVGIAVCTFWLGFPLGFVPSGFLFWPLGAASLLLITLLVQLEMLTLNSEVLDTVQP